MNEPFRDATHDDFSVMTDLLLRTRGLRVVAGSSMELATDDADEE